VDREHDLPEHEKVCPDTGKRLVKWIGQETSEQLAYQPATEYVIRHIQYKYARLEENLDGSKPEVVLAPKPAEGLPKCQAAPSLLASGAMWGTGSTGATTWCSDTRRVGVAPGPKASSRISRGKRDSTETCNATRTPASAGCSRKARSGS
jgi:hypothetical protein